MGKPLLTALSFLLVLCQLALPQMGFQIMVVTGQTVIHSGLHDDQSILEDSVIEDATNGVFAVSQSLDRQLQDSSFAYQAKYIANFQVLQDDNCLTAKPVIQIACQGYIQVVNTSNPSILCGTFPTIDESGWSYLRCNNTCSTDSACQDVYLAVGGNSLDGPFGGVEFRCAGDVLEDVEALILIEGRSDGACGLGTSSDSRIFHAAQLGISCPTASGIGSDYVYDDFLFECGSGRSGGRAVVGDRYTCFSGGRCLAGESCEIEVDPLYMNVSLPAVQTKCVNPTVPLPAPAPFSPTPNQPQLFSYKARFTAAWSLYSNQTSETACSSDVATVRIECTNADNLTMIEEPGQRLNCTMVGQVAMDCTKLDGNPANSYFPYIEFECSGPELPQTTLQYPATAATCNGNSLPVDLGHAVQLGVFCADADGDGVNYVEGVSFDDRFFECGNENHQFDYLTSSGATTGVIRWTCLEQATFPIGSIASQPKTIPSVSVLSDWTDTTNSKFCYTRNESPTSAPVSPVSVTSSPILTTTAPIVAPIAAAFPATFRPILLSSQVPSPATTRDSSGSSTGIVIGAAAGGAIVAIVFAIVVVVLVLRRSPSNNVKPVKDDTHDATSGGLPVEAHDEHVTDVEEHVAINRPIQRVSVSEASTPQNDTLSYATSNSASRPSVASSSSRPMNPNDLHYKDQSRSVQAIPIVSVVPPSIVDTQLQGRVDDSVQIDAYATAVATPVDMSHLSEISGASGGSGSTKRPTIDP